MAKDSEQKKITIRIPLLPYRRGSGKSPATRTANAGVPCSSEDMGVDEPLAEPPLLVSKDYCCFCGDFIRTKKNVCGDCGAFVCEQTQMFGSGCIQFGTAPPKGDFFCLLCDGKRWRALPEPDKKRLPYGFIGYGGRKRAKLTWPLVVVNVTLSTSFETFIADSLKLDLKFCFIGSPENLQFVDVFLKGNAQNQALKAMEAGRKFVARSIKSKVPANCFIVVDTHADTLTGGLQWAGGVTGVQTAPASEVIDQFCGEKFLNAMKGASDAARGFEPPQNPGWYADSPFLRGGWRGVFVASCAPAVRVESGFRDLKRLVVEDKFDFVLAFAGSSTISTFVKGAICQAIEGVGVNKSCEIWETLSRVVGRDVSLLHTNNVVVIYRERGGEVKCRQIGLHCPPVRAWGFEFTACGNEECRPTPYDFIIRDNGTGVRMTCRRCKWGSASLKLRDLDGLLFRLSSTVPDVFWHEYPPSVELQDLFVRVTKQRRL